MLLYFILGVLFISLFQPLVESLASYIAAIIEVKKAELSLQYAEIESKSSEITNTVKVKTNTIGFTSVETKSKDDAVDD